MLLSMETHVAHQLLGVRGGIKAIKDAGFDAFDFSYDWMEEKGGEDILDSNYVEYAKELKKYIDEIGIVCNQAHAPFNFKYGMKMDESDKAYVELIRSIRSAAILGAKNIVVHAICNVPDEEFEEYNLEFYKSLEIYAKEANIHISVENLFIPTVSMPWKGILATPEVLCSFVEKLDSPWFNVCIDVGHAAITGTEPEDFIAGMKTGVLKALHIQDTDYTTDRHELPFIGNIKWDKVFENLKKIGYDGELTFEVFGFMEHFPKEAMPEVIKLCEKVGRLLISKFEQK